MRRLGFALVAVLAGCGDKGVSTAGSTATDSAGVRLVTSTAPAWRDGDGWTVDTTPSLVIGDAAHKDAVLLSGVRGARLLADGRLAIVNEGDHGVVYLDANGKRVALADKAGVEPQAFRNVQLVAAAGDSLLLWDASLDRATLLTPDGAPIRTFALVRPDSSAATRFGFQPVGRFADGTLLLAGRIGAARGDSSRLSRDPIPLHRADATGHVGPLLLSVPGSETVIVTAGRYASLFERPFGARTVTAVRDTTLFVSTGDVDAVSVYAPTGRLVAQWRLDRPRHLIPSSDIAALGVKQGQQVAQLPAEFGSELRRVLLRIGVPATLPTTYEIQVDATGALWLRDDVGPVLRDSIPPRWTVLDHDGRWLGTVTTPRGVVVHQITKDRIVGVWRDPNDVEQVRVYRLRR